MLIKTLCSEVPQTPRLQCLDAVLPLVCPRLPPRTRIRTAGVRTRAVAETEPLRRQCCGGGCVRSVRAVKPTDSSRARRAPAARPARSRRAPGALPARARRAPERSRRVPGALPARARCARGARPVRARCAPGARPARAPCAPGARPARASV